MRVLVETLIEKLKLLYIWVRRILFAPDHFKTPLFRRLWLSFHGFVPDQYAIYDFKHCSYKNYLSEFDWYRSRRINGKDAYILNNKIVCAQMIGQYASIPETYFLKKEKNILSNNGSFVNDDFLIQCLKEKKKSIFKPINTGKGKHIFLIEFKDNAFHINGKIFKENELLSILHSKKDWFISEYIEQAAFLKSLFAASTNTLRMITVRDEKTNAFDVLFSVLRIGRNSSVPVDNASQGGLVAKVDLKTGELSEAKSLHNTEVYINHPDSDSLIKGVVIPDWKKLKESIISLSERFPYLDFIAWDILLVDDGFYVIEANASSGVNIVQIWGGQRNGKLGNIYRYHGIIK